jgi:hypothetical protein
MKKKVSKTNKKTEPVQHDKSEEKAVKPDKPIQPHEIASGMTEDQMIQLLDRLMALKDPN